MSETKDNEIRAMPTAENECPKISMRMGNTTYLIEMHFSAEGTETMEDKIKKMMLQDVKNDEF